MKHALAAFSLAGYGYWIGYVLR